MIFCYHRLLLLAFVMIASAAAIDGHVSLKKSKNFSNKSQFHYSIHCWLFLYVFVSWLVSMLNLACLSLMVRLNGTWLAGLCVKRPLKCKPNQNWMRVHFFFAAAYEIYIKQNNFKLITCMTNYMDFHRFFLSSAASGIFSAIELS